MWRLGRREYGETVALQEELVRQRRAGEIPDTLLLLEHEAVITVGRGHGPSASPPTPLPRSAALRSGEGGAATDGDDNGGGIPVVETSRGGEATYHGPGQLVAYPIVDLRQWRRDVHWYLRQLEAAGIETLRQLGVEAGNKPGHTGVWVQERKIASIGVAVRGWVTYHGLALNVDCDMSGFAGFNPCGLSSDTMVSLRELGLAAGVAEVATAFAQAFQGVLGYDRLHFLPETPEDVLRLRVVATTIDGR